MFLRQKSNEVLSMIRAPFKRKATPNDGAGGGDSGTVAATDANRKSARSASSPASSRASLVNLDEDGVSLSGRCLTPAGSLRESNGIRAHSDARHSHSPHASTSNIYTEIDVCNELFTNDLITDACASGDVTDFLTADVLRRLFNESTESLTANAVHTASACDNYANDSMLFHMYARLMAGSSSYAIDSDSNNGNDNGSRSDGWPNSAKDTHHTKEHAHSLGKYNDLFANIGKSLRHRFRMMTSDDAEALTDIEDGRTSAELSAATSSDRINLGMVAGSSLADRLKIKLKTGLKLFKDAKVGGPPHCSLAFSPHRGLARQIFVIRSHVALDT